MEIKLEITGVKTLTLEQRKAIQQKLEEIKAIAKNKETKAESLASRTIKKWLEKWNKRLLPHSINVELPKPKIYCTNSIENLVESVAKNSNSESIICYAAVIVDCKIT